VIPAGPSLFRPRSGARPPGRWHPAVRLAAAVLAVLTALLVPAIGVGALLALELGLLGLAGLSWRRLPRALRPWLGLAALVLVVHTLTATDDAPLGRPSSVGLVRGALALLRVAAMAAAVALARRSLALPELICGLSFWLRPLRPLGADAARLGLILAVALGAAPRVLDEARRAEAVLRLRRGQRRWQDRAAVVVPALESLMRRAESLPLALLGRVPSSAAPARPVPWPQGAVLALWTVLLAVVVW
jgi:energy-coupling factor transporter transmembrane protein EcfT